MRARFIPLSMRVCKSGPSGPRARFHYLLRGFSPAGPEGREKFAHDAAINDRSSTCVAGVHA